MPSTDQIIATGAPEGDRVIVDSDRNLSSEPAPSASDLEVVRVVYNDDAGELTLVRRNGSTEVIKGFSTKAQLSRSKRGRKGRQGHTGADGRDGYTGATGTPGCPGGRGLVGLDGEVGGDGEDGPDGAPGLMGRRGPRGEDGDEGEDGPIGNEGIVGMPGPNCISGKRGPTGPAPNGNCVESSTLPTDPAVFLWLLPLTGTERPVVPRWTNVVVNVKPKTIQAQRFQQTNIFTAMFDVEATATGGSGMYEYVWTVPDVKNTKFTPAGLRLRVEYSGKASDPSYPGELFTVKLQVRDIGRPGKPSFAAHAEIRIKV